MALTRNLYDVALNTPEGIAVHRIAVAAADRMRAELEAPKHKLEKAGAHNATSLWLWAALVRLGLVTVAYQEFRNTVLEEFAVVTDAAGDPVVETVDPTVPAASTSAPPSPSPPTSAEAPSTGSHAATPTSSTPPSS